jgi:hypothetical protein
MPIYILSKKYQTKLSITCDLCNRHYDILTSTLAFWTAQFTSGTPYIPQMCKVARSLYHSRDRIVATSRPLQIYNESANPIVAVFSCLLFFSYVRKYLLYGFRKINTNLLYTHNSYNMQQKLNNSKIM